MYLQLVLAWLVSRETAAVSARSVHTIQPAHCISLFMQRSIRIICNLPPALLAEWPGSFTCNCGNTAEGGGGGGGTDTEIRVSTEI